MTFYWPLPPLPQRMDGFPNMFLFFFHQDSPPQGADIRLPPVVSLQTFVHWWQEVRDLHVRSAEIFAGWGEKLDSGMISWMQG